MAGGWLHTGDAAVVHPDGYAQIRDRMKDVIISGGENISSIEVESMLLRHPAVMEAAVVGSPTHDGERHRTRLSSSSQTRGHKRRTSRVLASAPRPLQDASQLHHGRELAENRDGQDSRNTCCAKAAPRLPPNNEQARRTAAHESPQIRSKLNPRARRRGISSATVSHGVAPVRGRILVVAVVQHHDRSIRRRVGEPLATR